MSDYKERPVWSLTSPELLAALDQIHTDLARLQTTRLHLIAAAEDRGLAGELDAHDTAQLLAVRYRLDRAQAHRDVRLATALPKYRSVTAALDGPNHTPNGDGDGDGACDGDGGWIFYPAQAEAIVTVLERLPDTVPVEDLEVAERALVEAARLTPPSDLRKAARQAANILDTDGPEPTEHAAARRESLVIGRVDNGVKFRGFLANDNAELFYSLIHAGARPHKTVDGELDPRPRDKRQADALSSVLTLAAAATDTGSTGTGAGAGVGSTGGVAGFGAKANITVTIDLADLKSGLATATGETVYTDDLSAATIRRMACDAKIIPVVLGSNSEPLDVGRVERLVTRGMRRALNTRDKGCVVCQAPPIHCDAHHLEHWSTGGDTALHNLVLLCRRHHIDLHAGHWHITITNGIVNVARPDWADPHTRPKPQRLTPVPNTTCTTPWADEPIPDPTIPAWSTGPPDADPWADSDHHTEAEAS